MKISYQWLQSYFIKKLPKPEALAEALALGFAEVESVLKQGNDTILDVKVLPDRACYALSHEGIADEVSALTGLETKRREHATLKTARRMLEVAVRVAERALCPRYTARVIEGVAVAHSPAWLRERLESVGERSINNIVDATNFVMFDMGQPLHAFDADKVQGSITVRKAKTGETLTTLDGKELMLDTDALVIADEAGPLALAGVKGGKRAEVTGETRAIILEAASFSPALVRRASERFGIRTESSRRFEHNLSPWRAGEGSDACAALIQELCPSARLGTRVDLFPKKPRPKQIRLSPSFVRAALGVEVSDTEVRGALLALGLAVKKSGALLLVTPPPERRDLLLPEDLVEEVGRLVGYDKIPEVRINPLAPSNPDPISKHTIHDFLFSEGFSEVFTSSFAERGEVAIEKPLAADKAYCRADLATNFCLSLIRNFGNAPLLGTDIVRQFEIGSIFTTNGEKRALIIGAFPTKQSVRGVIVKLESVLGRKLSGKFCGGENIYECTL